MSKRVGIYSITSPSGKVYIGQSWDIERRWYMYSLGHCSAQRHLYNSLKKYGFAAHSLVALEVLPETVSQSLLDEREQFYMDSHTARGVILLNLRGGGSTGRLSVETKQKLREANLGKKHSAATRQKLSEWQIGLKRPHISVSNSRRGAPRSIIRLNAIQKGSLHPRFGMKHTPESLARMSASHKGAIFTDSHKAKISSKIRGEGNAAAILTETKVLEIRAKYIPRVYPSTRLAREYKVSKPTILAIIHGRLWKHILPRNVDWEAAA